MESFEGVERNLLHKILYLETDIMSARVKACIQKCSTTVGYVHNKQDKYITQRKRGETRLKLQWKALITILFNILNIQEDNNLLHNVRFRLIYLSPHL